MATLGRAAAEEQPAARRAGGLGSVSPSFSPAPHLGDAAANPRSSSPSGRDTLFSSFYLSLFLRFHCQACSLFKKIALWSAASCSKLKPARGPGRLVPGLWCAVLLQPTCCCRVPRSSRWLPPRVRGSDPSPPSPAHSPARLPVECITSVS